MKIPIPARSDAPATNLYVETFTANNKLLGSRDILLLVPGGPGGNHNVYNAVKDDLLIYADLIVFDPRGCGNSDFSEPQYCSLENYINDIEAVRQFFNLKKFILMGGSYGAIASLGYAIKYQAYIYKLILISGSPSYRFMKIAKKNLKERGTAEQIKAGEDLWNGTFKDSEHFNRFYTIMKSLYLFHSTHSDSSLPTLKAAVPYNVSIINLGSKEFLKTFDFEGDLSSIQCETLILSGKNDWIHDPSNAVVMAEKIPKNKCYIFENCGHFIWEDQREKFFEAIEKFLTVKKS